MHRSSKGIAIQKVSGGSDRSLRNLKHIKASANGVSARVVIQITCVRTSEQVFSYLAAIPVTVPELRTGLCRTVLPQSSITLAFAVPDRIVPSNEQKRHSPLSSPSATELR